MLIGFPYFVVIYSLPTYFQVVNERSALASGIALLPMLGSSAIGSTIAGAITGNKNNTFPLMVTGAALMLIGTAALSTLDSVTHTQAKAYGLQVFIGGGFGLTVSTSSIIAASESEIRDSAIAQGIVAQVRIFGGSIGIAASTAILGSRQRQKLLQTRILTPSQMESLRDVMADLTPNQIHAIKQVYTDSFNKTLVVCSIIAGSMIISAVLNVELSHRLDADVMEYLERLPDGYRLHPECIRLPDKILRFYIDKLRALPVILEVLSINELNLVLAQFEGDDPLLDFSEMCNGDVEGLLHFCSELALPTK
ncbi:hypothetical protein N0V90_003986 [Kalmusia sp. IMI 367209]|nr:hypothetical protein N0V90_003986 [Kalmusia sp. IMI 367209]